METKFLNELYEMVEELKKDNNKKQLLIKYKEFLPKLVSSIYPINSVDITRLIMEILNLSIDIDPLTFEVNRLVYMIGELTLLLCDARLSLENSSESQIETDLILKLLNSYFLITRKSKPIKIFYDETIQVLYDALQALRLHNDTNLQLKQNIESFSIHISHYNQFLLPVSSEITRNLDVSSKEKCLSLVAALLKILNSFKKITCSKCVTNNSIEIWQIIFFILDEIGSKLNYLNHKGGQNNHFISKHEVFVMIHCLRLSSSLLNSSIDIPSIMYNNLFNMIDLTASIRTEFVLGSYLDEFLLTFINYASKIFGSMNSNLFKSKFCKSIVNMIKMAEDDSLIGPLCSQFSEIIRKIKPSTTIMSSLLYPLISNPKVDKFIVNILCNSIYCELEEKSNYTAPQQKKRKSMDNSSLTKSNILNHILQFLNNSKIHENSDMLSLVPLRILEIALKYKDIFNRKENENSSYFDDIIISTYLSNLIESAKVYTSKNSIKTQEQYLFFIHMTNLIRKYMIELSKIESYRMESLNIKILSYYNNLWKFISITMKNELLHSPHLETYAYQLVDRFFCSINWMPYPSYTSNIQKIFKSAIQDSSEMIQSCGIKHLPFHFVRHGVSQLNSFMTIIESLLKKNINLDVQSYISLFITKIPCIAKFSSSMEDMKNEHINGKVAKIYYEEILYEDNEVYILYCNDCSSKHSKKDYFIVESDLLDSYRSNMINEIPSNIFSYNIWKPFIEIIYHAPISPELTAKLLKFSTRSIIRHCLVEQLSKKSITEEEYNYFNSELNNQINYLLKYTLNPDYNIRISCAKVLSVIIEKKEVKGSSPLNLKIIQEVFKKLETANTEVESYSYYESIIETLLITMRYIACSSNGWYILPPLISMIPFLVHDSLKIRSIVYDQLNQFSKKKNLSMHNIIYGFNGKIYWKLVKQLITNPILVEEAAVALLDQDTESFLKSGLTTLLRNVAIPKIVLSVNDDLLNEISRILKVNPSSLLLDSLEPVLFSIMVNGYDVQKTNPACKYLYKKLNTRLSTLIERCRSGLLKRIVLLLGDEESRQKGECALEAVINFSSYQRTSHQSSRGNIVADFLKEHFLELADEIIHKNILKVNENPSDGTTKTQALLSLNELIVYIKPYLSNFYLKITASLKLIMDQFPSLRIPACKCYLTLFKNLDSRDISPILGQTVVHLYPFLEDIDEHVVEILKHLIIERQQELYTHFHDIPFIPDKPSLSEIKLVWEKYVQHGINNGDGLRKQIKELTRLIENESENIRLMSLHQLMIVLSSRRKEINEILLRDTVDPTINSLVEALVKGCRDQNLTVRTKFGEVLGKLGPIDPGILNVNIHPELPELNKKEEQIAQEIIENFLVKAYRSATNVSAQDNAAYAIQEILKCYLCDAKTPLLGSVPDYNLSENQKVAWSFWSQLSNDVRIIIQPFLTSKYAYISNNTSSNSLSSISESVYKPSMKFNKWIYEWTQRLISDANVQMYKPLTCVIKDELDLCQYLIPHLVIKIFHDGSASAKKAILNEILSIINSSQDGNVNQMAVQQIFGLISCLTNYIEKKKREFLMIKGNQSLKAEVKKKYSEIEKILHQIPQSYLAQAALKSNAYARALLHFENSIRYSSKSSTRRSITELTLSDINMLQQIYLGLDQPDAISGIVSLQTESSPISSIIEYEAECKWDEALMSIEHALQQNISPEKEQELRMIRLRCLREIGYYDQLLNLVKLSLHEESFKVSNDLISYGTQAAFRLGQWELAEEFLKQTKSSDRQINDRFTDIDFDIAIAHLLTDLKKGESMSFRSRLIKTRKEIMEPLAAASLDSYQRAYPLINRLHILSEINDSWKLLHSSGNLQMSDLSHTNGEVSQNTNITHSIISNWDDILKISQPSFKIREPILSIRLAAYELAWMTDKLAKTWMQIAKYARTSGRSRMAHYALFKVRELKEPRYYIEKAKLLWSTKQEQAALLELQNIMKNNPIETSNRPVKAKKELSLSLLTKTSQKQPIEEEEILFNKALLLMTRWMHETGQISHNDIVKQYETVTTRMPHWEKGFFYFGRYFDQLVQEFKKEVYKNREMNEPDFASDNLDVKKPYWDYIPHVIYNYGAAMLRGQNYIYQTMPKILTLWLDAGESLSDILQSQSSEKQQTKVVSGSTIPTKTKGALENALVSNWPLIQGIMKYLIDNLPCHLWMSTFPRLVSRVNHRNPEVWVLLLKLIVKILGMYPQQSIWHLLPLSQSNNYKKKKYDEIRSKVISHMHSHGNTKIETILDEAEYVAKEFLTICNYPVSRDFLSKQSSIIVIQKMSEIKSNIPSNLILPTEKQLNEFNLATMVYIRDFGTNVQIMKSQQRPKKVRILGSDGKSYDFLFKPKDDLRKDSRMMEFSTMINKLLKKDPEGRRRELIIRTYSVIPLNDDSGIIGWVPNTTGFRNILMNQYALEGIVYNEQLRQIKELYENQRRSNFPKIFQERVLPLLKPIFWKWFISNFSEPSRWYRARLAFAHTTAVMSMVGAIVGLGDRHAENIMIDSKTGECVHVDLNCLFMKGLTFKEPELVPFRLTQNMVDALGVTGYEGIFRRVCEITMRTLRNNKESLISVMETLLHDPLIEWANNNSKNANGKEKATDKYNIEALETLKGISDRIDGIKRTPDNKDDVLLPLSIEGHVNSLINDATSIENLAYMYIGWTAFL